VLGSDLNGYRPFIRTDIASRMLGVNASAFVRIPFAVTDPASINTLKLNLRYDDGFVAYLNGVEIARRNAPGGLAWNSVATADRDLAAGVTPESLDLTASVPLLVEGTNVLAFQVLNASVGDPNLLLQPELISTRARRTSNVFLADPTPGARNDSDYYYDEVADTKFSVDRGFFEAPFSLAITSATPEAQIYYSFNGDEPGPGRGVLYTGPLVITNTTVVRARAFKEGWKPTDVDTATYLFLGDVIYQAAGWQQTRVPPPNFPASWGANAVDYGMDPNVVGNYTLVQWKEALTQIPSLSVVTEMNNLFDPMTGIYANALQHGTDWERPASIEMFEPTQGVPGVFQLNCGLRIRGGYSRNVQYVKHSFRVFFRNAYGAGKLHYPIFGESGAGEFETFDLRTSQNYSWSLGDAHETSVREEFCEETLGALGQPYRRNRYVHLYLNGQYWGLYEFDERPEASYGQTYFGGSKTNYDVVKCGNHVANFVTEATDGNMLVWSNLWSQCQAMRTAPNNPNYFRILGCNPDGTRNPALPVLLDVDNLIDYMLEIFYSGDGDATLSSFLGNNEPNNWFGMRDRTNPDIGFRFFNSDAEHTLGAPSSQVDRTGPFGGSNEGNFAYSNPQWMHEELMRNAEYRLRFADHVQKHFFNGGALTYEAGTNRFLARAAQINKAVRAYSARWGDAGREPPLGEREWAAEVNWVLTNWFPSRAGIVLAQLRVDNLFPAVAAPQFSQAGGEVPAGFSLDLAQTNASGAIYFTTDGSDPRLVGGVVAGSAQAYSAPLPINAPTVVRARVLAGTNWSALIEYTFHPPQDFSKLAVTEIMYNPPAIGLVDGDEFEFLELKNTGAVTLHLSGLRFTAGITFSFTNGTTLAPGAFFVLVRNPAQFAAKYPGAPFHGVYAGKLDNSGETLVLSHPLGTTVLALTYDDAAPWPLASDGLGFSLVPREGASPNLDDPSHWRASAFPGGSPGADDPGSALPSVFVNEALTHSETNVDFIELFNPNAVDVDIGGWFLTDDPGAPRKFRIPDGTLVGPLGYVVFDEAQFNPAPGNGDSFSLSARGEGVYLFSGDAGTNLTGFSHGFEFGAAPDGETFGRYVISTGEEQFPPQLAPTPNAPNSGPRVGPVVLSEIQYHPDTGDLEFVELQNVTTNPVPLFDPAHPTNTWRLDGLGYTFPTDLTLPPRGLLVLAATDPALFRARYAVPVEVPVLGPYPGLLQDSGERLELQRPDVPDTNGVAYVAVDTVRYNDKAPWPAAADGSGPSLHRKNPAAYGNDPANWEAAVPSPGVAFRGGQAPQFLTQPQSQSLFSGQTAVFSFGAAGAPPLSFQWRFNGTPIPGATATNLTLPNVQPPQAGTYSVVVFNEAGSVLSAPAVLTVKRLPTFSVPPTNQFVRLGSNAIFSVSVTGSGILRYQWQFQGTNLPGATNLS
ncbi:MAG TPA: lamin tail domain-containing protein, partial [Candidatus Saccharimonadales bacterium]|nr:lamin tail domain-containing protein [Candidatus Saccharimonadales bacterium]